MELTAGLLYWMNNSEQLTEPLSLKAQVFRFMTTRQLSGEAGSTTANTKPPTLMLSVLA